MKNFRILIHHHAVAYRDSSNRIHISSFIGRWVNALAVYFGEIGLLLSESDVLRPDQDEVIQADNVTLWSLGAPGKTWDRISRIRHLQKVCAQAAQQTDGLLIRGVTPRQMDVWKATPVKNKVFLLVGSLLQTKPKFTLSFWGIYELLIWRWRRIELMQISRKGLLMANSPLLVDEMTRLNRHATFVPTNSIRLDEFSPFVISELSNPRKILFCGRVVAEKGITELIHAVAILNIIQPCMLDIVGPIKPSFRLELEELTRKLGISENVKWLGRIPYGEALFTFYRQADVFVLPTYYEGFPHVIWEAAANCCPVITTQVGGIPALWKDMQHGLLVSPKNASVIAEAMGKLFNDETLRKRLIENAYLYAREFTVEACAARLVQTLSESGWNK